jgi:hypothetical protein
VAVTPLELLDYADHDNGNCILTVTDQGIVGFMDESQAEGSGFVFPEGGDNQLYIGSLWVGLDPEYIANRDYSPDPDEEWVVAEDPGGHIWIDEDGTSDRDIYAGFTDNGAALPRQLHVRQESWSYNEYPDEDFVVLRYLIQNRSEELLTGVFVGLFLDLDIGIPGENTGDSDQIHQVIYQTDGSGVYVGVRHLMCWGQPPANNLAFLNNPTYVYPQGYVLDADKYGFLSAEPGYVVPEASAPSDWSCVVSAGPLTLEAGGVEEVAFAILGGDGLADLLANSDRAQQRYCPTTQDAETESEDAILANRLFPCVPNPFKLTTTIRFELIQAEPLEIGIYDVDGRSIRTLAHGPKRAGRHTLVWDGRNEAGRPVAGGLYFVRFRAGDVRQSGQIIVLR